MSDSFFIGLEKILYFGYARTALEYGYKLFGLKSGDEILYPDYICDIALVPCNRLGINVKFYKVKDNLEPDLNDAEKLLTPKTKALLAVHYFGFPAPVNRIKKFCDEHNLYFIEDCAHSFLTEIGSKRIGDFGDSSSFSYWKTIPVLNGAALKVNSEQVKIDYINSTYAEFNNILLKESNFIRKLKKHIRRRLHSLSFPIEPFKVFSNTIGVRETNMNQEKPFQIDETSKKIIANYNWDKEKYRRKRKFNQFIKRFSGSTFCPMYSQLKEGVVPLCIPFYVENRDELIVELRSKGIAASSWPNLPPQILSKPDSSALKIKDRLLIMYL